MQPARVRQRRDRTAASGGTGTDSAAAESAPAANGLGTEDAPVDAITLIPVEQVLAPPSLVEPGSADSLEV